MILFVALALGVVPMLERNRQAEMMFGILLIMAGLVGLGGAILALVGQCMCCAAPDSGPKGLAIGSAVCLVITLLLGTGVVLLTIVQEQRQPFGRPNLAPLIAVLYLMTLVVGIVGHVLFGFFLRGIASYFHNGALSRSAGIYLILVGAFVASCILALLMLILLDATRVLRDRDTARILSLVLGVGLLILALVLVLWFLDILGQARTTVTKALEEGW
jgi:hypothetical protein